MRLWHYELIPYLPKSQLLAQWRELNSIFKKQDKHILINYIYEYPKEDLFVYTQIVLKEMVLRGYKINSIDNFYDYFGWVISPEASLRMPKYPFVKHHTFRYMRQCFFNLQEKYDRGQKDFSQEQYEALEKFVAAHFEEGRLVEV